MAKILHNLSDLNSFEVELLTLAKNVSFNAYNKYSNFFVGAAVRTKSGITYTGTFLDNVSTGLTICAEPAAIMNANTNNDFNITSIAVVGGPTAGESSNYVTPCGRCRQIILEAAQVSNTNITIYCSNLTLSKILISDIHEMLPFPFVRE